LAALNQALPLYARATPKIASAVEAARFLLTSGIPARTRPDLGPLCLEVEAPASVLVDTQIFRSGGITIQDASAQWVSAFAGSAIEGLDAPVVVDYCAAPGGKTTHLAGIMSGRGRLVACDVSAARLGRLQENVARLGYQDFVEIAILEPEARKVRREPDPSPNADLVLVDAPCSGLGTLRRHPEIRWRLPHAELGRLAALQGEILERAARLVRPGGTLVYATCSLAEEENEAVVQAFLSKRGENYEPIFETESLPEPLRGRVGADGWLRSMPPADETDGARAIRLRRKDQGPAHG
jgi:16S rRNA (cytosine967-C5)-methyltransferase